MRNNYSFSEFIKTLYSFILTKFFYSNARLIRRPVYIRGKKSILGGKKLTIGRFCRFDLDGKKKTLIIGDNCEFGDYTHIVALQNVTIGNNVLIASKVFISDTSHGSYDLDLDKILSIPPNKRQLVSHSLEIQDNVWIGENSVILSGVKIGKGSVIGANSIITKDVENYSIVVGNNKVIKRLKKDE